MSDLTHIDRDAQVRMVDIGEKPVSERSASASAAVFLSEVAFREVTKGENRKGNIFAVARVAGIMAAKRTSELIPLCHTLPLTHVSVDFDPDPTNSSIRIIATASVSAKTGVEMEAMTAAAIAALTIYDMCKGIDRGIRIGDLRLKMKTGGNSGAYVAE
jgi:cyclic pyranopterin phosphate synthase